MRLSRIILLVTLAAGVLAACGLTAQNPTPPPIIIIASPTTQGIATSAAPAATAAAAPATATTAAAAPTAAAQPTAGPAPTVATGSPSKGTVTFAFDEFPTYYPGIIIEVKELLKTRGYDLKLV